VAPGTYYGAAPFKAEFETYDGSIISRAVDGNYTYGVQILDPTTIPNKLGL
jgi:hypothetical protein